MRYAKTVAVSKSVLAEIVRRYISEEFELLLEVPVESRKLGVVGRVDAVAVAILEAIPIEIKLDTSPRKMKRFSYHHLAQVVAYAIAVEETFRKPVRKALIISSEGNTVFEITIGLSLREYIYRLSKELMKIVEEEKIPRPTSNKKKCKTCFYRKFCFNI